MSKILIVDDNAEILHLMQLILTSRGYTVETTTKGEDTLPLIQSFQPDLIFLDIILIGMNGMNICRELKSTEATKDINIILFSANVSQKKAMENSGADGYLAKPFDLHELVSKVKDLIGEPVTSSSMTA
jgi:DNA-binding response OmpR family regulator